MNEFTITEDFGKVIITKENAFKNSMFKRRAQGDVRLYLTEPGTVFGGGPGQGDDVYFISDKHQYKKWERHEGYLQSIKITARDLTVYPRQIKEIINKDLQYVEIGAGLGEPVCAIALRKGVSKPIVIDPADYLLLEQMLIFARDELAEKLEEEKSRKIFRMNAPRINTLIERCKIIQDSDKVTLFNMPLNQASRYGRLQNIADVVVDFWGPKCNSDIYNEGEQKSINELELRFLKSTGKLIQYKNDGLDNYVYNSRGQKIEAIRF